MATPSANSETSPGSVARAPAPGVSRASAPPIWRSCNRAPLSPRPGPGPRAPGGQHLVGALDREEQRARVELVDRLDLELDRGDDAEVAAASAQRPEQLGMVLVVGADEAVLGRDELDRGDRVGLHAVLARQ